MHESHTRQHQPQPLQVDAQTATGDAAGGLAGGFVQRRAVRHQESEEGMTERELIVKLREALKMWDDWAKNADLMDELNCDFALSVMRNGVHKEKLDATSAALALEVPGEKCERCGNTGSVPDYDGGFRVCPKCTGAKP